MRILSRWDLKFDVIIYFQIVQYSTEVVNFIRTLDCCRKVWSQPQTCDLRSTATTNRNNYEIKKRWRETLWFLLNIVKFCLRSQVRPQPQPKFRVWFFFSFGNAFWKFAPRGSIFQLKIRDTCKLKFRTFFTIIFYTFEDTCYFYIVDIFI